MRDLDQLEEHDPEQRSNRTGVIVMFGAMALLFAFAMFAMLGPAASSRSSAADADPLDQLDRVIGAAAKQAPGAAETPAQPAVAQKAEPAVDTTKLTFEHALTDNEERPEVLAALEAAAREEETLQANQVAKLPIDRLPVVDEVAPLPAAALVEKAERDARDDDAVAPVRIREERSRVAMPAGLVASSASGRLAKAARHDKLVAAAMPNRSNLPRARVGAEGEYTLQVISFESPGPAQELADSLRAKGYEAFVTMGEIDGRGRYYRVRIGPFNSMSQAQATRHTFETMEHMNTIVVRRPKNEQPERSD